MRELETRAWEWSDCEGRLKLTTFRPDISTVEPLTRLAPAQAEIERMTRERDDALRECSKWAREAGLAKGKLEASELAGVVDDWQARALSAEERVRVLEEAAEPFAKLWDQIGEDDRVRRAWRVAVQTTSDDVRKLRAALTALQKAK